MQEELEILIKPDGTTEIKVVRSKGDCHGLTKPLEQALGWIVENDLGLRWVLVDGALFISDAEGITAKAGVLEIYDVEDILYASRMPDFEGPPLLSGMGNGVAPGIVLDSPSSDRDVKSRRGLTPERLMKILRRTVEPGDWTDDED